MSSQTPEYLTIQEIEGIFYRWAANQYEDDTARGRLVKEIAECNRLFEQDKHSERFKRRLVPRCWTEWKALRAEFAEGWRGQDLPVGWGQGRPIGYGE